ncbi:hypothetical protein HX884_04290 [Enterobacter sp. SECR19-1250]|uniref:hypothetical protein n=1 Tax=Enterobacter sp. SECR19-1250 TaxID=2749084 RepID=UPI0015B6D49D|nr:hypothetical protein [Enterobacter sp. SECR19-1250]NWJ78863.1 hypothetical protein [Enterobacter sp. SECR19-1250]
MKRLFTFAFPILIVGCTTTDTTIGKSTELATDDISVSVIPADKAISRLSDTVDVYVPQQNLTVIKNRLTSPYTRSVEIRNGKEVREVRDSIEYGSTVTVKISPKDTQQRVVTLDIKHKCPPPFMAFSPSGATDHHVDLSAFRLSMMQQQLLIQKGDSLQIRTASAGAACSGEDIIIHPIELPLP